MKMKPTDLETGAGAAAKQGTKDKKRKREDVTEDADKEEKKKDKKRSKVEESDDMQGVKSNAGADADAEEEERRRRKEKKQAKKEKKRAQKQKKASAAFSAATSDLSSSEEDKKSKDVEMPEAAPPVKKVAPATPKAQPQQAKPAAAATSSSTAFRRDFYTEHPDTTKLSAAEITSFREAQSIHVHGSTHKPILAFSASTFAKNLLKPCEGFERPTPIQSETWPLALSGRNVIGIAATGTGKTIAFLLPGLVHLLDQVQKGGKKTRKGPILLVLSPTRELAMQIAEVASVAGAACGVKSVCVYGGVDKGPQRQALRSGVEMCIATPGRLLDLIEEGVCDLSNVTYAVLDEADRMLDLGFERDVRTILAKVRQDRQTLMFSATWPQSVQALASEFLGSTPARVTVGSAELCASHAVTQIVEVLDVRDKERRLLELLKKYHSSRKNRVLVFVLYKAESGRIERMLASHGWKAQAISGDRTQAERTRALATFKDGTCPLLIATDVAARGLDIPEVEAVLNFTFPLTIEDYVHRIGRTGRGGATGIAHTLFTVNDKSHSGELVNVLREANQTVPDALMKFGTHVKRKEHKMYGAHYKGDEDGQPMKEKIHVKFD